MYVYLSVCVCIYIYMYIYIYIYIYISIYLRTGMYICIFMCTDSYLCLYRDQRTTPIPNLLTCPRADIYTTLQRHVQRVFIRTSETCNVKLKPKKLIHDH